MLSGKIFQFRVMTQKGTVFMWTVERQAAFDALKSCLLPYRIGPVCVRAMGSRDRIHQSESPTVTAPVLHHSPGDVGRRHDGHSLSFIPPWC